MIPIQLQLLEPAVRKKAICQIAGRNAALFHFCFCKICHRHGTVCKAGVVDTALAEVCSHKLAIIKANMVKPASGKTAPRQLAVFKQDMFKVGFLQPAANDRTVFKNHSVEIEVTEIFLFYMFAAKLYPLNIIFLFPASVYISIKIAGRFSQLR